jgi:hypothetical protein
VKWLRIDIRASQRYIEGKKRRKALMLVGGCPITLKPYEMEKYINHHMSIIPHIRGQKKP